MITVYLDETGESTDTKQHIAGMAGLIGMDDDWEIFKQKWMRALHEAKVPLYRDAKQPYFHMREFKVSTQTFKGWEDKKAAGDKLYNELITILETSRVVPFGSVMPLSTWRKLTDRQQGYFLDPYYFSAQFCIWNIMSLTADRPPGEKVAVVFSEKKKVKKRIGQLFDLFRKYESVRGRIADPVFHDMREFVPLQGADVVAYALNNEYRREMFKPEETPDETYIRLFAAQKKFVDRQDGLFNFISEARVMAEVKEVEADIARRKQVNE